MDFCYVDPDGNQAFKAEYRIGNKTPDIMRLLEDWRMVKSNYF